MFKTDPAALALLEEKRLSLRKQYFGRREVSGVSFAFGNELVKCAGKRFKPGNQTPLTAAIRRAFPNSDPKYLRLIERRFTEAYGVPEDEAIKAVSLGYSSPSAAMNARVIKRRPYLGFEGQR